MKDYKAKISTLVRTRDPEYSTRMDESYFSSLRKATDFVLSDTEKYLFAAMEPVDLKYTNKTFDEAKKIIATIETLNDEKYKGFEITFEYQGSVTNNTHVKGYSDIDVLTLHGAFNTCEPPVEVLYPYKGDPINDLLVLRRDEFILLKKTYYTATVDDSGAKSIKISGGSLHRSIDIVPSNLIITKEYEDTKDKKYLGIYILDKDKKLRIKNTPFLHNALLEDKDIYTNGGFKKCVRMMKTISYEMESENTLSSYDITALLYNIENSQYRSVENLSITFTNLFIFFNKVSDDEQFRNSLYVPDKSRKIFDSNDKLTKFKNLQKEYMDIYVDLLVNNQKVG
ncbi:MAG TPA: hypothetical protein PKU84_13920 [Spirochaetota bacterium]|nr:hypothetical protein [Spirochaetota bacterium]HPK57589.1 hypothetical protein [Spirochaetota bacterium]